MKCDAIEPGCCGVLHRIGGVNAVDLGSFQDRVRFYFECAQSCGGISREEWIARSRSENYYAPFLKVTNRAPANEWLGQLRDIDRGKDARLNADFFKCILQNHRVHYGRQHANVVSRRAIHVAGAGGHAAKDVPTTDDDRNLNSELVSFLDFFSDRTRDINIYAERLFAQQRFAGEL